jgi:hypothetical protein
VVSGELKAFEVDGLVLGELDRTTLEMRGLSPKIISEDPQQSENTQTQHISTQYHDIKVEVKVIIVLVPCIRFTQVEAKERFKK